MRLKNKVAVVTGAATNIGAGIAKKLAKEQANVVINYYSTEQKTEAEKLSEQIKTEGGAETKIFQADVGDNVSLEALFKFAIDNFGKLDILVNNAMLGGMSALLKPFTEITEDEFYKAFRVNTKGVFFACQRMFELMGDGGRIINISSNSTAMILPNYGLYDSTKGAVEQITRIVSKEIGKRNITVNAVSPGPIDTPDWDNRPEELKKSLYALTSMNRFGTIEEVANVVAFLASDEASWVTGQNIRVNGGAI